MNLETAAKLRRQGQYEDCLKAIEILKKSLPALSPEASRKASFLKADALLDMKRYRDAITCYDELLAEAPSDVAYANQGLAHWELKEYQQALGCYLNAVRMNPSNAIAQRGVGEMHIKLGAPKIAIGFLDRALELNPDYQAAYTSAGIALYQAGEWSKAHRMLAKALDLDPEDWEAKEGLALIEKHFGK